MIVVGSSIPVGEGENGVAINVDVRERPAGIPSQCDSMVNPRDAVVVDTQSARAAAKLQIDAPARVDRRKVVYAQVVSNSVGVNAIHGAVIDRGIGRAGMVVE